MFGPFGAGDSLRIYRLQRRGVSLDLQRDLTQPSSPLWEAWLAFVTQQAMGQPTYVLADLHDGEGFVQIRYRPHQAAADVTFLAPMPSRSKSDAIWPQLLDGAGIEAAGRGIQRVFANLPESGAEADLFQQSGFMLYAREDVYRLAHVPAERHGENVPDLRPQRTEDWSALQKLCVAITPQRVRQAEGWIGLATTGEKNCQRFILPGSNGEEVVAALSLCTGHIGHWLRLVVHPDTRDVADGLLRWGLGLLAGQPPRPVYCNVRQYEGGVRTALEAEGFELCATRALTVKHTLAWSKVSTPELVPALKSSAEAAPPAYRINGESDGRLAAGQEQ